MHDVFLCFNHGRIVPVDTWLKLKCDKHSGFIVKNKLCKNRSNGKW